MNNIKYIVIHCSDSPDGRDVDAAMIHRWHRDDNGWDGIGYHHVIKRNGEIEQGRPEYWQGAHVRHYNDNSIGICIIGREHFSFQQYQSLSILVKEVLHRHPKALVVGHGELDLAKTCPNIDINGWCVSEGIIQ